MDTLKEFNLNRKQAKKILHEFEDLQAQAELYDMDMDLETWELKPKRIKKITWWEKFNNQDRDFDPRMDIDNG